MDKKNSSQCKPARIIDPNGLSWIWNGERIVLQGDDSEDAGYWADTLEEALKIVFENSGGIVDAAD